MMDNNNNCGKYDTQEDINQSPCYNGVELGRLVEVSPGYFVGIWGFFRLLFWIVALGVFGYLVYCCLIGEAPYSVGVAGATMVASRCKSKDKRYYYLCTRKSISFYAGFLPQEGAGLCLMGEWFIVSYVYGCADVKLIEPERGL